MRLIDADKLKEECHWVIRSDGTRVFVCHDFDIDDAPTIDAEPVVRCGECKHFNGEIPYHFCRKAGGNFKIDSFCSYGERRAE